MELDKFLRAPRFSHDREAMLMHKLIYDCRLALAQLNDRLQVLTGEVDHDGFDVVFNDSSNHKQFQVKVAYGTAQSWSVHRRLLRPTTEIADWFSFPSTPEGIGVDGGFILQELGISSAGGLVVHYCYNALYILGEQDGRFQSFVGRF